MIDQTRQKSVKSMLYKYDSDPLHAMQVSKLSLIIFDKTKGLIHNFSDNERDCLEAGATLHDIGYHISATEHNKNSKKLIKKNGIEGFSDQEVKIIAKIARYHKGKLPKKEANPDNKLAAIVRIADALDRTHCSVVKDIDLLFNSFTKNLTFMLKLNIPDCNFEILRAHEKKKLFEKEFDLELDFRAG